MGNTPSGPICGGEQNIRPQPNQRRVNTSLRAANADGDTLAEPFAANVHPQQPQPQPQPQQPMFRELEIQANSAAALSAVAAEALTQTNHTSASRDNQQPTEAVAIEGPGSDTEASDEASDATDVSESSNSQGDSDLDDEDFSSPTTPVDGETNMLLHFRMQQQLQQQFLAHTPRCDTPHGDVKPTANAAADDDASYAGDNNKEQCEAFVEQALRFARNIRNNADNSEFEQRRAAMMNGVLLPGEVPEGAATGIRLGHNDGEAHPSAFKRASRSRTPRK